MSSDPAPIGEICSSQNKAEARTGSQQEPENSSQEEAGSSQEVEAVEVSMEKRVDVVKNTSEGKEIEGLQLLPPSSAASELHNAAVNSSIESSSFSATESVTKSFTSTPGYLANRWNTGNSSFSTPTSSEAPMFSTPPM